MEIGQAAKIAELTAQRNEAIANAAKWSVWTAGTAAEVGVVEAGMAGAGAMVAPVAEASAIANTPPGATPPPATPTKPDSGKKAPSQTSPLKPGRVKGQIPAPTHGTSPIQKQHRDDRGQPDYKPIRIIILNGDFKNQELDLGLDISEVAHSEGRNWESQESDKVRPGLNFKNIDNRQISFDVTFFDIEHDISHLVENLKHCGQITGAEAAPPRLLFVQGSLRAVECVCTSFQDKYSEPLPGRKGYRKAVVAMELKLIGGRDNPNSLGAPLTSTPLQNWLDRTSVQERQRQAKTGLIDTLMAPCLKQKSGELKALIDSNQQGNVDAIAQLDPEVFVQSAIAGVFSPELLKSERLQAKLRDSLALAIASNEPGVGRSEAVRQFANALATGNSDGLSGAAKDQYKVALFDFVKIYQAISDQYLEETSAVFAGSENLSARNRLFELGSCGLDLRRNGGKNLDLSSTDEARGLKAINTFFAGKPTKEQVMERFGANEKLAKTLMNGAPYQSKNEFIKHTSQNQPETQGYGLWGKFEKG